MVREAWFGATEAGMVGAGFARLAVPQNAVATGAGHGAAATHFVEQAAAAFTEAAVHFLRETDGLGTACLYKVGEKSLRAVVFVHQHVFDAPCGNGHQNLGNPVGVRRTTGNVYHWKCFSFRFCKWWIVCFGDVAKYFLFSFTRFGKIYFTRISIFDYDDFRWRLYSAITR